MNIAQRISIDAAAKSYVSKPRKLLIDGDWVNAASGKTFPVYDPSTGEVMVQVAEADAADVDKAVKGARKAFDEGPWPRMSPSERGRLLWKLSDLIEKHAEEFATLEALDNVLAGYGETAGAALAAHPHVDKIAFTGSTEVGKLIVHAAAGNLKKVSLELGGKSPNVVFKDADIDAAIAGSASAIFFNHGQCCCAGSRLYVEKPVYDQVVEGVADHARKIKVGSGLDPETQMGPLVSLEQLNRVCGYLEAGFSEGAKAAAGGHKAGNRGYFVEPTVLVNTQEHMKVVQEEIFGPVVTAMPFTDPEEIIPRANNSDYGLAAAVWTRDIGKAHRMADQLRAGTVWINCYNIFDAAMPFGGYKQSGWGREMGHDALNLYTQTKAVCTRIA